MTTPELKNPPDQLHQQRQQYAKKYHGANREIESEIVFFNPDISG